LAASDSSDEVTGSYSLPRVRTTGGKPGPFNEKWQVKMLKEQIQRGNPPLFNADEAG